MAFIRAAAIVQIDKSGHSRLLVGGSAEAMRVLELWMRLLLDQPLFGQAAGGASVAAPDGAEIGEQGIGD